MGGLVDKHAKKYNNAEGEESEIMLVRYKPEGLTELCQSTRFSKKELQLMYRGFKQESPTGMVDKVSFKEIYQHYFPSGNANTYASYVFDAFDLDKNGSISFDEFATGLSVLSRGSIQEKLQWTFNLYDINRDGRITWDEMHRIVSAIYDMLSKSVRFSDETIRKHVDRVFQKMDANRDGVITIDEFTNVCETDNEILQSFAKFDTQWY